MPLASARAGLRQQRSTGGGGSSSFSDSFNRADSTTTLGAPWTVALADGTAGTLAYGISTNRAYVPTNSTGFQESIAYVDLGIADIDMSATVAAFISGAASAGGLMFRGDNVNGGFWLASQVSLQYKTAGGGLALKAAYSSAFANGDTMRVVAKGSAITVYNGATTVLSTSDTRNQTATRHGLEGSYRTGANSIYWDSFSLAPAP